MAGIQRLIDNFLDGRLPILADAELDMKARLDLCRRYGDFALAYSTAVQPDLKHYGDCDGYLAYATKMGHTFVLGDPVSDQNSRRDYITRFVNASEWPCFVQIGSDTASVLSDLGYRVNHMGVDTRLSLDAPIFTGKRNETIRYSERWLLKKNYSVVECDGSFADVDRVSAISAEWRAGRIVNRREMRFLNRPFQAELSADMRRFLLIDPDGRAIALLDFDPLFHGDRIVGYTVAFKRKLTGTTPHAELGLTKFAVDRFKEEGRSLVTFGLSPLAAMSASGYPESHRWRFWFERAFRSKQVNSRIFNLQGQAAFKRRFHGEEVATYIAFKRGTPLEMLALLRLLKTL